MLLQSPAGCILGTVVDASSLFTPLESGIIVESEVMLVDPKGVPYARMVVSGSSDTGGAPPELTIFVSKTSSFNVGAKAVGPFSKAIASAPKRASIPENKQGKPDHVVEETTTPEQALIYRLSGDYNPLHIGKSTHTQCTCQI